MKVLVAGHRYELELFEPESHASRMHGQPQFVQFIHKEPVKDGSKVMRTVSPGTTNEEVLEMMIDRMKFLQERCPCVENEMVINRLFECSHLLQARTARRKAAGIEGQHTEPVTNADFEQQQQQPQQQPPVDNAHVAEGCEQFAEPTARADGTEEHTD